MQTVVPLSHVHHCDDRLALPTGCSLCSLTSLPLLQVHRLLQAVAWPAWSRSLPFPLPLSSAPAPHPPPPFLFQRQVHSITTATATATATATSATACTCTCITATIRHLPRKDRAAGPPASRVATARGIRNCRIEPQIRACPCCSISLARTSPLQNSTPRHRRRRQRQPQQQHRLSPAPAPALRRHTHCCCRRRRRRPHPRHQRRRRDHALPTQLGLLQRRAPDTSRTLRTLEAVPAAGWLQRLHTLHPEINDQLNSPP